MNRVIVLLCLLIIIRCGIDNSRSFEFVYEVELDSTNGKKIEVWVPIPQSNEVQIISDLIINTGGLEYTIELENVHKNKYVYINDESGVNELKRITIKFTVERLEHENVDYSNVDPSNYLNSNTMVPVGGVFDKVIKDNQLSKNNVRGIYDYVFEGMHYGKPKSIDNKYYKDPWLSADGLYGNKQVGRDSVVNLYKKAKINGGNYTFGNGNAIYACDIGVGNCTDYHSYFISIDRTLGIPARFHMGFPIANNKEGIIDGYHCWADYYIEGEGWYPVDISEADKDPSKKDYYFGKVDNNRVEMVVGRDLILKGYELGIANLFIYPLLEVDDVQSTAFTKKLSYKN